MTAERRILVVRVQPKASRQELIRLSETEYRARLLSAPDRGRANQELLELLSESLHLPRQRLKIIRGESSRVKWIEIS